MTERERLIEILKSHGIGAETESGLDILDDVAEILLANGVIVTPCKVGDVVFVKYYGEIVNAYVTEFEINSRGIVAKVYIDPDTDREYDAEDLFLTKEEAENALKDRDAE